MHTHNSESQQQVVGVAAAVASIFIRNFGVVISLVFVFLLHLVCVGLVGCRLVCHPACGDSGRGGFSAGRIHVSTSFSTCWPAQYSALVDDAPLAL